MRVLNEAWEILKDAERRAVYDAATGSPGSAGGHGGPSRATDDADRPFWTGAAGPPPGRPSGPVLDFGIFAGWSLGEIARRDPGYLQWLRDRPEGKPIRAEINRLLDPDTEPARETSGRRR